MTKPSHHTLRQLAQNASVVIIDGMGPCPVFSRGDRRRPASHWLSRSTVKTLQAEGILTPSPLGLVITPDYIETLAKQTHASLRT